MKAMIAHGLDEKVRARLRAPFGKELIGNQWRIFDASDDPLCRVHDHVYANVIVDALNYYFGQGKR